MLTLVQFAPCWGLPSPSPFCLKVETFIRMASIEYCVESRTTPYKTPRSQLPFIKDEGQEIPDSEAILAYLDKHYELSLDEFLSEKDLAIGIAVKRLCEHHLYWALFYSRWYDKQDWSKIKKEFFSSVPLIFRSTVSGLARKSALISLNRQGFGRLPRETVYEKGQQDIDALAIILGDNNYMLGHQPSSYDASAFGVLANILYPPFSTNLKSALRQRPNLIAYCERMKSIYFSEY